MSVFKKKDVSPNTAKKTVERNGQLVEEKEMPIDPYPELCKKDGMAQVSCTYGMGVDYNSEKVSFFVSIRCDQDQAAINRAGELAFNKAVEFVGDAAEALGWKKTS